MTKQAFEILVNHGFSIERRDEFGFPDKNSYIFAFSFETKHYHGCLRFTDGDDQHIFDQMDGAYFQFRDTVGIADRLIREGRETGEFSREDKDWLVQCCMERAELLKETRTDLARLVLKEIREDNVIVFHRPES